MATKATVYFSVELPEDLLGVFIQHIRDFDASHADCHFQVMANTEQAEAEMEAWIDRIDPPLPFRRIFRK